MPAHHPRLPHRPQVAAWHVKKYCEGGALERRLATRISVNLHLFRSQFVAASFLSGVCVAAEMPPSIPVAELSHRPALQSEWESDGRTTIKLTVRNRSPSPATIAIPAGLICARQGGRDRAISLRAATLTIPPGDSAEAVLPSVALSTKSPAGSSPFVPTNDAEPKLAPLLTWLAAQSDTPRATVQLVVFTLLENITFAQWQVFLAAPPDLAVAVDALGILRTIDPASSPALARDSDLKGRALREPNTRAKAMQLYGLSLPDETQGGVAPEIGQLLHRTPGDNCPICRARARMQQGAGDF